MLGKFILTVLISLSFTGLSAAFLSPEEFNNQTIHEDPDADRLRDQMDRRNFDGIDSVEERDYRRVRQMRDSDADILQDQRMRRDLDGAESEQERAYRRATEMPDSDADNDFLLRDHPLQERPLQEGQLR